MISHLSVAQRMQVWRFLRIATLSCAGALVASGGHIAPSAIVGVVAGAIETALRQANPAVPLSGVHDYIATKLETPASTSSAPASTPHEPAGG